MQIEMKLMLFFIFVCTVAAEPTLRQSTGLPTHYYHHSNSGLPALSSSPSPTPSPNAHRTGGGLYFLKILFQMEM